MTGGTGNDRYHVDGTSDHIVEALNGGTDIAYATIHVLAARARAERRAACG